MKYKVNDKVCIIPKIFNSDTKLFESMEFYVQGTVFSITEAGFYHISYLHPRDNKEYIGMYKESEIKDLC